MFFINKITSHETIDFAGEELKRYLRMMMPEGGDVKIANDPKAKEGFRLGLMQDFGLDVSDAEDTELDDILYIDCDEKGGIIAGSNPRSVLLSVYEYLRQNGCRWLYPGIDGEYIPMQNIAPVKYRFKPSLRYRGWCSEGGQFHEDVIEAIDFAPKVGMNVYMIQFMNPFAFYNSYYAHLKNQENRPPEKISSKQALQWKRHCETEMTKRSIQFHDIGHGFTYLPFGISTEKNADGSYVTPVTDEQLELLSMIDGKRQLYKNTPLNTNFCMSNPKAREKVANYVVDFSKNHSNIDYLHIWLADGANNHCECEECRKKTPSDWYVILLNEIDEKLTEAGLDTRIVFISYVDTTWAPIEEKIKNTSRFTLLFAPIYRSFAYSVEKNRAKTELVPFKHNNNVFPQSLGSSLDYLEEWQKVWPGSCVSFEYHYWRHQCYDLSGLMQAKVINSDVKRYEENRVDGVIACGSQRSFFPSGLSFYTYARTLFDTSLTYEKIEEDYLSHAFGENWRDLRDYLQKIYDALPFEYFSRDEIVKYQENHTSPERVATIQGIRNITKEGRKLIEANYSSEYRVQTLSMKLLRYHADFCDLISDWMAEKAKGNKEKANELYEYARVEFGKVESEIQKYFDHFIYFGEYYWTQNFDKYMVNGVFTL